MAYTVVVSVWTGATGVQEDFSVRVDTTVDVITDVAPPVVTVLKIVLAGAVTCCSSLACT